MRIVGGLVLIIVGALITIYSEAIFQMFGRVPFAEEHFGSEGGSRLFYKLLGMLVVVLGTLIMTNMFGALFLSIFGRILPTP